MANVMLEILDLYSFTPIQNLKSLVKTWTLNAGILGLTSKRNRLKSLTLHSPFCPAIRKNIQTELPCWVLWNLFLSMKPSNVLQNGSFNIETQNLELINLKCVTYAQPIPLSLTFSAQASSAEPATFSTFAQNLKFQAIIVMRLFSNENVLVWVQTPPVFVTHQEDRGHPRFEAYPRLEDVLTYISDPVLRRLQTAASNPVSGNLTIMYATEVCWDSVRVALCIRN